MTRPVRHVGSAFRRLILLALATAIPALAGTKKWDGGGTTDNWSEAANWTPDGAPGAGDAVVLDNTSLNPLPQIAAASGGNCSTLTVDGAIAATFLNYGGATPLVTNLYGATVDPTDTGPLLRITANAPATLTANKINFQLRTSGELFVAAGRRLTLSNSFISQNGTRALTKTGAGTVDFSGSGSQVTFTGGLNVAEGVWNASADTLDLPTSGLVTFTNPSGVAATITSSNSHSIAGLAGGNASSECIVTGTTGLTITGSATTTFSGRLRGATRLNYSGTGSLTLNGSNTFTGPTTLNSGTLALGAAGSLASTPSITIAAGATFQVGAVPGGFTLGSGRTLAGSGTVAGRLNAASGAVVAPGSTAAGVLTITNGFSLAADATLAVHLDGLASQDAVAVSNGDISLAGTLSAVSGYAAAVGDTIYLVRNLGPGATTGTLSGVGDGGKLDLGGQWWRVSFTSSFGGSGFAVGGTGNDVAIQRISDPSPSGLSTSIVGPTNEALARLSISWTDNTNAETGYRVFRVLADGTLALATTLPANATTFAETVSNYVSYRYAVQAFNAAGPIGDVSFSAPFQAGTSMADRHDAMLDWLSTEVPNLGQFGDGPNRIGRTGFFCATGRILRGDTATGVSYITTALEDANAEGPNAGFSMWPGMDAYLRWNTLFPQSLKDRYQQIYVGADAYDNGSTPNQRFMLATASYLANGIWGPGVNSTSSAANGIGGASGRDFILHILNKTPFLNHEEHNSHHYLQYTLAAIETLAQFAQDAEVRDKARMVIDWSVAEASGYMQNGRWCVSSTRGRAQLQQYDYDNTGWTWHVLFGGPAPASYFGSFATAPFLAPQFPVPPAESMAAGQLRTQSYTRRSLAQRYLGGGDIAYFKQCWMTPTYALWSQVEGDVTYNADGSMNLVDLNTAGIQDGYQGHRWGLAWDDPPWFDSMITITSPTTYSGSTGGISVYEDTLQHEDTVIAVYNIPAPAGQTGNNGSFPNQYVKGDIPNGYLAYIDQSDALGRIFLHYGAVLVSIQLTDLFPNFSGSPGFQYPCSKLGLVMETASPSEYPQATATDRLAAFRNDILTRTTTDKTGINEAAPRLIYTNRHGDVLDLTYGLAGRINGTTVDYQSWPVLEDPWMRQAQNGHLHRFGTNRVVTSNYYDWSQSVNTRPSMTSTAVASVVNGTAIDIDLSTRVADAETAPGNLAFTVGSPTGGTVSLLADGKTARFTPTTAGAGAFAFTASDRGLNPRAIFHYDCEPPATLTANRLRDVTLQQRDATLSFAGSGTATLAADTPALLGANSTQSLRLNETGTAAARLQRTVTRSNLEMSNGSWTFAGWFKRATRTTDDFLFFIGVSDGFGGNGDELQLRCAANADTLRLEHFNNANVLDVSIVSGAVAPANVWHHAAVTFEKTADNTGTARLYLNGTLVGSTAVTWALRQDAPLVIGGVNSTAAAVIPRYFNGWIDDCALFRGALSASEVASLARQSVATFSGLSVGSTVPVTVLTRLEGWRQQFFGTTANTGAAADLSDGNGDSEVNLVEFATGQHPLAATRAGTALARSGSALQFTYSRANAAVADGVLFAVEWSDTLASGSWTGTGVTEQITTDNGTVQTVVASIPSAGSARRFARLRITRP